MFTSVYANWVAIPKGRYSETHIRIAFPKGRYSEGSLLRRVVIPKGLYTKGRYSDTNIGVAIPKGCYSESPQYHAKTSRWEAT